MFLLNSRLSLLSETPSGFYGMQSPNEAPLLPRLRGYFAEFLDESSLARLSTLRARPPVSVSGTGAPHPGHEAFLVSVG